VKIVFGFRVPYHDLVCGAWKLSKEILEQVPQ
jgi:hypothetical protein